MSTSAAAQPDDDDVDVKDDILDSFRVLGVPRHFGVSHDTLKQSYRTLMTEFHPDKHTNKSMEERDYVDVKASQITNAYQVLRLPHTRATHLLELLGNPMDETSNTEVVGAEFLMQIMEWRETIDAISESDSSESEEQLKPLKEELQQVLAQVVQELEAAFEAHDYSKAVELSGQLQYWHRIDTEIHEKMEAE
jgi:Fe-S protein assembly co-chaperone HscB